MSLVLNNWAQCSSVQYSQPGCLTPGQVKKGIASLNKGKAAHFYSVTPKHFLYSGEEHLRITTDILNSLYRFGQLTESMKTGVLTHVYKRNGWANDAKNYRGITILLMFTKILETVLKKTVRPAVESHLNNLQ